MSTRVEAASGMTDTLKWIVSALLLAAGLVGFYYFSDSSVLLRVIGLLLAIGAAIAMAIQTERGHGLWEFMRESRTEVRKVVWPTVKETQQTTLLVLALVTAVALMLWFMDTILAALMRVLLEQGG